MISKPSLKKLLLEHLAFNLLIVTALAYSKWSIDSASFIFGAIAYIVPLVGFAWAFFGKVATNPMTMVNRLFMAEVFKWLLLAVILLFVFQIPSLVAGVFFIAYILNQLFTWFTPTYRRLIHI